MSGRKRGPGVTDAMERAAWAARDDRLAREAAEEAKVQELYADAMAHGRDTTPQAIRTARAERKAQDDAERRAKQAAAARQAVEPRGTTVGPPKGTGFGIDAIRAALIEWQGEWPPTEPGFAGVVARADRTIRWHLNHNRTDWQREIERAEAYRQ